MSAPRIELHIEELVLDGFPRGYRARIAASLEAELSRLLSDRGARGLESAEYRYIDGGTFTMTPSARPADIGRQVARSVVGGLTGR